MNENQKTTTFWDSIDEKWNENVVTDLNAPQLYSKQVIAVFSILFSVLFGGILLAVNLKTINRKKAILPVLVYSVVYTGLMIYLLNLLPGYRSGLPLLLNMLGAMVLYNYFWRRSIGNAFKHRTRPFWIPLIIGIGISAVFIWAIFAGSAL